MTTGQKCAFAHCVKFWRRVKLFIKYQTDDSQKIGFTVGLLKSLASYECS
jgi:hypothetical protein